VMHHSEMGVAPKLVNAARTLDGNGEGACMET
jgi:hypothetical protein